MKKLFCFTILLITLSNSLISQNIVVKLNVNQPPEFGFSLLKSDTTISENTSVELGSDVLIFGGFGDYQYLWTPGESLSDSTVINPIATPMDTTNYLLRVTDNSGCSFLVNYTVNVKKSTVSSDLMYAANTLQAVLYPNPNNGKFRVKLTGLPVEKIYLSIIDNTGNVIKKQTLTNFTGNHTEIINQKLASGIYTLVINNTVEVVNHQFIIY